MSRTISVIDLLIFLPPIINSSTTTVSAVITCMFICASRILTTRANHLQISLLCASLISNNLIIGLAMFSMSVVLSIIYTEALCFVWIILLVAANTPTSGNPVNASLYSCEVCIGIATLAVALHIITSNKSDRGDAILFMTGSVAAVCVATIDWIWLLEFLAMNSRIVIYWLGITCIFIIVINRVSDSNWVGVNTKRKLVHLFILAIYIVPILSDTASVRILNLASFAVACFLVIIECIRVAEFPFLSNPINALYSGFLSDRDQGLLVLSPLYLIIGVSFPIWMSNFANHTNTLLISCGVVSIGIGDSFASIIGQKYGRNVYAGSQKSLEGSLAYLVSSLVGFVLINGNVLLDTYRFAFLAIGILGSCILEAITEQNDNLVLPIYLYACFARF